jgi:uncharacterized membrane protein YcaP (DUF421 family)
VVFVTDFESALFEVNWPEIFLPVHSLVEIVVRGSLTYIMLFLVLRFLLKRQTGVIGIADLLVVVLIADAAQNAMAAEYKSITEGVILVGTITFWNFAVDWLGYQFPRFRWLTRPSPLCLIRDGRMIRRNMRKEFITDEELMAQLRKQGVERAEDVKEAYIEGDGRISVVKNDD